MPRRKRTRFGSGSELREVAQDEFSRSLSAEEWSLVDPTNAYGLYTEYDEADLDDLLKSMRSLPGRPKQSLQRRQRAAAMARTRRLAVEVRDLVCELRTELFQVPDPPIRTRRGSRSSLDRVTVWVYGHRRFFFDHRYTD